ncbi:unnamed protein product, partial [Iphiclides podalirius]
MQASRVFRGELSGALAREYFITHPVRVANNVTCVLISASTPLGRNDNAGGGRVYDRMFFRVRNMHIALRTSVPL